MLLLRQTKTMPKLANKVVCVVQVFALVQHKIENKVDTCGGALGCGRVTRPFEPEEELFRCPSASVLFRSIFQV